jgi:hypothetical protein
VRSALEQLRQHLSRSPYAPSSSRVVADAHHLFAAPARSRSACPAGSASPRDMVVAPTVRCSGHVAALQGVGNWESGSTTASPHRAIIPHPCPHGAILTARRFRGIEVILRPRQTCSRSLVAGSPPGSGGSGDRRHPDHTSAADFGGMRTSGGPAASRLPDRYSREVAVCPPGAWQGSMKTRRHPETRGRCDPDEAANLPTAPPPSGEMPQRATTSHPHAADTPAPWYWRSTGLSREEATLPASFSGGARPRRPPRTGHWYSCT